MFILKKRICVLTPPLGILVHSRYYLQAEGVAPYVPPEAHPVPDSWGQPERKPVPDPQQPPVQRPVISLQTQLRLGCVDRAVREGHPGSGPHHTDVHAHGHLEEQWHGGPVRQGPVVLTAIQHRLGVSQEIAKCWNGRRKYRCEGWTCYQQYFKLNTSFLKNKITIWTSFISNHLWVERLPAAKDRWLGGNAASMSTVLHTSSWQHRVKWTHSKWDKLLPFGLINLPLVCYFPIHKAIAVPNIQISFQGFYWRTDFVGPPASSCSSHIPPVTTSPFLDMITAYVSALGLHIKLSFAAGKLKRSNIVREGWTPGQGWTQQILLHSAKFTHL